MNRATKPAPLEGDQPTTAGRFMKFDPTVTTGTIIQTAMLVASIAVGYGKYTEDQTKQDGRIAQVEVLADRDRESTKETLREIQRQMGDLQRSNQGILESLAVLRGRTAESGGRK